MAATSKYGEAFDAEYVDRMFGQVMVQACSFVTFAKPNDPIEYLSLWLHKYCDNAIILQNYEKEKVHKAHKEYKEKESAMKKFLEEQDLKQKQHSVINYMKSITDDPYMLWETCLEAISNFTGCQAAYVAVVVKKIFQPKKEKKAKAEGEEGEEEVAAAEEEEEPVYEEGEEGEDGEAKGVGSDDSSVDEEPAEAEEMPKNDEEGKDALDEAKVKGEEGVEEGELKQEEREVIDTKSSPPKPPRLPKKITYKNRILLYVAATIPRQIHMLSRELDIKKGPVTYDLLMEEQPNLHIPNVLYKEGIHYFGGVPRVGAYFVVPMTIQFIAKKYLANDFKDRPKDWFDLVRQKKVIALLCCDTLKTESIGNGRPFQEIEREFILNCATTLSGILDGNNKFIIKDQNTQAIIDKFNENLRNIKLARKAQLEKEHDDAIKDKKEKERMERKKRFEDAHKIWIERQTTKVEALKKKEEEKKAKIKGREEILEEEEVVEGEEEDDLEPVLKPEPEEEAPTEGDPKSTTEEETPLEEEEEEGGEEGEEGEEGKKLKDELNDDELEPDPMAGLEKPEGEEEEDEDGEKGAGDEEAVEDEVVEEEEEEPKEAEGGETTLEFEEGAEPIVESEDMKKLKKKKVDNLKMEKEIKKKMKDLTKLIKGFDKNRAKALAELDALGIEAEKYELALQIANGVVKYLKIRMDDIYSLLIENKSAELDRIKRWPYPNRHVQRVLKALLYLLGHKKLVIDDWSSARKLFNPDFLDKVIKNYDPLATVDSNLWKAADSYLVGLKDEKLADQACIGFLLQQWILACKKTTVAGMKYHTIKTKYEEISKDFATKEMEKIMCEVETQLASEKLKKLNADEEKRARKAKAEIEAEEKSLADIAVAELEAKEVEDKTATAGKGEAEPEAEGI